MYRRLGSFAFKRECNRDGLNSIVDPFNPIEMKLATPRIFTFDFNRAANFRADQFAGAVVLSPKVIKLKKVTHLIDLLASKPLQICDRRNRGILVVADIPNVLWAIYEQQLPDRHHSARFSAFP